MILYDLPQQWDIEARDTVELAAHIVGTRLAKYTGLDAAASFDAVFGTVRTWFSPGLKTYAEANWGNIKFQSKKVIVLPLVIHELGHLFAVRAKNRPTKQMWIDRLMDTGAASPWPGMHPPYLKGYNIVERFCSSAWEPWVMELYAQNAAGITPAGRALAAWMDAHMGEWCAVARGGKG